MILRAQIKNLYIGFTRPINELTNILNSMGQFNVFPPNISQQLEEVFEPIILSHPLQEEHQKFFEDNHYTITDLFPRQEIEFKKIQSLKGESLEITEDSSNWIVYPWKKTVVRILSEKEFVSVRTSRNNFKITPSEQDVLKSKTVGVVGLSVGQSVAITIAMERGAGTLKLADFDELDLSNLNRLRSSLVNIGLKKSVIIAREIAEIDPYIKVQLYSDGITEQNVSDFFTGDSPLDLVIEECDSIDIKFLVREYAKKHKIALLMDTSDRGMLDVERYDLKGDYPFFHGLAHQLDYNAVKGLNQQQKMGLILSVMEGNKASSRMKYSLLEMNRTISSWPQLASSIMLGAGITANFSRKILLNQSVDKGRHIFAEEKKIAENRNLLTPAFIKGEGFLGNKNFIEVFEKGSIEYQFIEGLLSKDSSNKIYLGNPLFEKTNQHPAWDKAVEFNEVISLLNLSLQHNEIDAQVSLQLSFALDPEVRQLIVENGHPFWKLISPNLSEPVTAMLRVNLGNDKSYYSTGASIRSYLKENHPDFEVHWEGMVLNMLLGKYDMIPLKSKNTDQ